MSYRPQTAFSAGELDPALHERTDLDKYRTGLATLRNAVIGKTGRVISRPGTQYQYTTKFPNQPSVIYSPPYTQYIIEWGVGYVRIHDTVAGTFTDDPHDWGAAQIPNLHFAASLDFVYIFSTGYPVKKMCLVALTGTFPYDLRFMTTANIFSLLPPPTLANPVYGGSGYAVDYAFTYVFGGIESDFVEALNSVTGALLPVSAGQTYSVLVSTNNPPVSSSNKYLLTQINAYRRPAGGNAYGFIGSIALPTGALGTTFVDVGGTADYTHSPPFSIPIPVPLTNKNSRSIGPYRGGGTATVTQVKNPVTTLTSKTGAIYQQRLLLSDDSNPENIYASRTGFQNSFFQESTLTPDSAVSFKSGSTGSASVLKLYDSIYGLLAFTQIGIFQNSGGLSFSNLALNKISTMILQDNVPPIDVPGGIFAVDKSTNSVQSLIYSYVEQTFPPDEVSLFAAHLFKNKTVVSWAFQDGDIPIIWLVMSDGSLLSVTYKREQQMRAWARHDTNGGKFESVTVLKNLNAQSVVYFQVNRNGKRSIESLAPRSLTDLKQYIGMDAATTFNSSLNSTIGYFPADPDLQNSLPQQATFNIVAQDIQNWAGTLNFSSNYPVFANVAGKGKVGDVFRFFDSQGSAVDLTVTLYLSPTQILVTPSVEFPADQGNNVTIYATFSTLTGLGYLEGQSVSVLLDGFVEASPNNDIEEYETYVVTNGQITLADGKLGAFVQVGIPFTCDVETLDIDTVEQKPALLESKIVNKVWIKVLNTRGLYVADKFPENCDNVGGMTDPEDIYENPLTGFVGNKTQDPITKRYDIVCRNDWSSNGRVAIRQVDPLPFEILSIIPDLQVIV